MTDNVTQEQPVQVELTLADIINVRNLIEVVSTRGAFKAGELTSVGQLFDKINSFVTVATKKPEDTPAEGVNNNLEN